MVEYWSRRGRSALRWIRRTIHREYLMDSGFIRWLERLLWWCRGERWMWLPTIFCRNSRVQRGAQLWRVHVQKGKSYLSDEEWSDWSLRQRVVGILSTVEYQDWQWHGEWMSEWSQKIFRVPRLDSECHLFSRQWTRERGEIWLTRVRLIRWESGWSKQTRVIRAIEQRWGLMYQLGGGIVSCEYSTVPFFFVNRYSREIVDKKDSYSLLWK